MTRIRVLDALAAAIALASFVLILSDASIFFRPVTVLVFLLLVPGWATLRLAGAPATPMAFLAAFVLSVALAILTGTLLVQVLDWQWRAAGLGTSFASLAALLFSTFRPTSAKVTLPTGLGT